MPNCLQNGDSRYSDDLIIMLQTFDDLDHTSDENKHNDAMIHTGVFFGWSALKMSARPLGNSDTFFMGFTM